MGRFGLRICFVLVFVFLLSLFSVSAFNVLSNVKISDGLGGFTETLEGSDYFGYDVDAVGDLDNNGVVDLAVGAMLDENGDSAEGALYILFMSSDGTVNSSVKISDGLNGFNPSGLEAGDRFGRSVASIGDLDSNGVQDLAVGADLDENGDGAEGALYILFMNVNGSVNSSVKISDGLNGFSPSNLAADDRFGRSVANIGDLDNNGVVDLAVGAYLDENSNSAEGALYILFMNVNGSVNSSVKISDGLGGFSPTGLAADDWFGSCVANVGDLDADGVQDLAVGAFGVDSDEGALYILFMNVNGTVNDSVEVADGLAGFSPSGLIAGDYFGSGVSSLGDLDGDGFIDLAVGANGDENSNNEEGAIYVLFTNYSVASAPASAVSSGTRALLPASGLLSVLFGGLMVFGYFLFS